MVVIRQKVKAESIPLNNESFRNDCVGFWGNVIGINTEELSVDVQACTGMKYKGIPCISKEWVVYDENKDYVPGERDLPPLNSRVFVMMPTHTLSGAFVLCSGFARGEPSVRNLFAKNETEKTDFRTIKEHISQGGWIEKEYAENGNTTITSKDGKISIDLVIADDSKNSLEKEVKIVAWDQTIKINKDGVSINTDKKIKLDGSEIDLNGDSKSLVTYAELNTALSSLITALNSHVHICAAPESPSLVPSVPLQLDISAAEATKVKTGGGVQNGILE